MRVNRRLPVGIFIGTLLVLSGCGLWGIEQANNSDHPDINYKEEGESLDMENRDDEADEEENSATVKTKLFLIDKDGLVVPQTMALPETPGVAKQSLQYLVKDGPVSNMLPDGFQAVLPAGTEVLGADLKGDTLVVNFSEEFKEYRAEDEKEIAQAITWTATQFDNIENVKVQIDGVAQDAMPVDGTVIGDDGLSRADGINEKVGDAVDMTGTKAVTLYFPAKGQDDRYFVPVTQRVKADQGNIVAAVEGLFEGPSTDSGLSGIFDQNARLVSDPVIEDNVLTLNFNQAVLADKEEETISNEALNSLVLSLTTQEGIEKVAIQVDGEMKVRNEAGEMIAEPISRPNDVNTVGL